MNAAEDAALTILRVDGSQAAIDRAIACEVPVAIEIDGFGYAVMMMTPQDFGDFATGFLLTERLIDAPADILDIDPFETERGWIVRVALVERCRARIHDRVRHRTSDTSCGLCGISGLEQVARPLAYRATRPAAPAPALFAALSALRAHQPLNVQTGAVHAAAACDAAGTILAVREDVGRHNALDKLIGHLAGAPVPAFLLVTSRISYEMVDKALVIDAPILVGISAPTTLALSHARTHDLTLVALARPDAMLVAHDPFGWFATDPE